MLLLGPVPMPVQDVSRLRIALLRGSSAPLCLLSAARAQHHCGPYPDPARMPTLQSMDAAGLSITWGSFCDPVGFPPRQCLRLWGSASLHTES